MNDHLSYAKTGVDIDVTDAAKRSMAEFINRGNKRVLNRMGAFASLVEGRFEGYRHPILVLKTEEPGSKQKLAFQYGYISSITYDLINHLINDVMVMGAEPLYVQDCIICGAIEPAIAQTIVGGIQDNLNRVLPPSLDAFIDLSCIKIPKVFGMIRDQGNVTDSDMLRTFNMGVGLVVVCSPEAADDFISHLADQKCESYIIGNIIEGSKVVRFHNELKW